MSDSVFQVNEFTAICKTDCLLLELDQDLFEVLNKQRLKRIRDFRMNHFLLTFPKCPQLYSTQSIIEKVQKIMSSEVVYSKGQNIIREGCFSQKLGDRLDLSCEGNEEKIHIIIEGTVTLWKRIQFQNFDNSLCTRNEKIMELHENEVIGEDHMLFGRECQYTATVSSRSATLFQIDHKDFCHSFAKLIKYLRPIFTARHQFMSQRCELLRFLNEYKSLALHKPQSFKISNKWFLHKQYFFKDGNNKIIDHKFWPIFKRQLDSVDHKAVSISKETESNRRKETSEKINENLASKISIGSSILDAQSRQEQDVGALATSS